LPAAPVGKRQLTVLSANLLNPFARPCRLDRRELLARLNAFADLAESEGADVLLCQEAGRGHDFRVDNWLAERLSMAVVYTPANGNAERLGREEGLAIFSRYPLTEPKTTLLADGLWRRPALSAVIHSPLGEVAVYTAHLSLRPWRNRQQPAKLRAWVEATAGAMPAIIGGDFNAGESAPPIAALQANWIDAFRALNPMADGATHEMKLSGLTLLRRRLDYLFLRPGAPGLRIVNCVHLQSPKIAFSDHLAVVAKIASG
jgi:endonuclease/exonuclease/phosphatase family metal-dependent hydrolase